ncbi:MAG TPA: thiosulfate oxidation carrier complex protein SoxZ [Geminicoccaceae bacterium]|nr:thiosulfate oxidation carrier complex protein SoxZ [Geminicoccaceae bacterium]
MAEIGQPRVKLPASVGRGEIFQVQTLVAHPMENGRRRGLQGELVPRRIINRFTCTAGGTELFRAELHPSMAANPYLAFWCRLDRSSDLRFAWFDDDGGIYTATHRVEVVA